PRAAPEAAPPAISGRRVARPRGGLVLARKLREETDRRPGRFRLGLFVLDSNNAQASGHLAGGVQERLGNRRLRLADADRPAFIATAPNADVERDPTQQRDVVLFAQTLATAVAEDLGRLVAVWALEVAHVLHDAGDWDAELGEHA